MIEYMIAGCPFIYQTFNGDVYEVSDVVTWIDDRWSPTAPVVAFLDADCPTFAPQPFLNNRRVQLIAAASPEGATQPYMSQLAHDSLMLQLATALWSPNELFLTGFVPPP